MKNHYHLLVHTKETNLSRTIQWLGVSYSVWFNRRHQRCGHLFQGRLKSFLIENDRYFTAMCLYIHGNPVRANILKDSGDNRWSSYRVYAEGGHEVPWLTTGLVLGMYGGGQQQRTGYRFTCSYKITCLRSAGSRKDISVLPLFSLTSNSIIPGYF